MMSLACVGGQAVVDVLVREVASTDQVGLMTQLVEAFKDESYMGKMVQWSLSSAGSRHQWNMVRYLLTVATPKVISAQRDGLLRALSGACDAPLDLFKTHLAKLAASDKNEKRGQLLAVASRDGSLPVVTALMEGPGMPEIWLTASVVGAATFKRLDVMEYLMPSVSIDAAADLFIERIKKARDSLVVTRLPELCEGLDLMGRFFDDAQLTSWVQRFPDEDLPRSTARLREQRAARAGGADQEEIQITTRPRARP